MKYTWKGMSEGKEVWYSMNRNGKIKIDTRNIVSFVKTPILIFLCNLVPIKETSCLYMEIKTINLNMTEKIFFK